MRPTRSTRSVEIAPLDKQRGRERARLMHEREEPQVAQIVGRRLADVGRLQRDDAHELAVHVRRELAQPHLLRIRGRGRGGARSRWQGSPSAHLALLERGRAPHRLDHLLDEQLARQVGRHAQRELEHRGEVRRAAERALAERRAHLVGHEGGGHAPQPLREHLDRRLVLVELKQRLC